MLKDLNSLRNKQNLSVRQLSEKSGVSKSAIGDIENAVTIPRIDTVCKLAKGLGLSCEELFQVLIANENYSDTNE